ncbi:MAG: isoprenylcysteine carboxylmethyltransferase family protein [Ignavibacteria bacterium]|jgi:protein-S-isoprenylcysteine O-methyltransferase Ste14|nr:isoprenylcysteine carboxylmethyltransferase family protein [Ignavibacteria bacterium]MCU7503308.1 isoprenylcysteine carboxylmethyltransferase family protein [Ignavibacteria bacterium]MCU7515746.1 isoprenylcysteine carboxylmethyltransferase family protein [Ignavibacteria bacterium]
MSLIWDVFAIVLLYFLFGLLHSYLASRKLKKKIADRYGDYIAFYRLFYNLVSFLSFMLLLEFAPKPDRIVYDLSTPFDIIVFSLQALSLVFLIWSFTEFDLLEFLGIRQIIRWYDGTYSKEDLDEKGTLVTKGLYKLSRHPVYLFTMLFLGLRPQMDLFYLVSFLCLTAYFYAGSVFEERKLVERFGQEYKDYKRRVPRILPLKFKWKD